MTQGLLSITKNGETVMKIIAGCDGYNINSLLNLVKLEHDFSDPEIFYKMALNKVNISNDVINTNNHVFNVANLEYGYCIIDQQLVKCTNTVTLER